MWVDASEIWAPDIRSQHESLAVSYTLAIALAENECVETTFPANNPIPQAPEIWCINPMAPNSASSFWSEHLASRVSATANTPAALHSAVNEVYRIWTERFRDAVEIHVPYRRPYFIEEGVLKKTAGLVQIRDFATEMNDRELLDAVQLIRSRQRQAKEEFYDLLVSKNGIDYFGQGSSRTARAHAPSRAPSTLDEVLEKRLALAAAIVSESESDKNLGRTKLAKVFYLVDASQRLNLKTVYYRHTAGPLDPRALYNDKIGIERLAAKRGYFVSSSGGGSIAYKPAKELPALLKRAPELFGSKWKHIKGVIGVCRSLNTDQCEIAATLYACWNDLLIEGKEVNDEIVLREFLMNWHEKKRRFPKQRLINALAWMRKTKLVPEGLGQHTKAKASR